MIDVKITRARLDKKIRKLDSRFNNTRPLMLAIAEDMLDAVEENFDKEGRPKWPKLRPLTKIIRRQNNKNGPILQPGNAGGLASSITTYATDNEAVAGTNKKYAKYVTKGFRQKVTKKQRFYFGMKYGIWMKEGRVLKMPPRPFLKLTGGDVARIKDRAGRYFSDV